jgi:hypothetical protein
MSEMKTKMESNVKLLIETLDTEAKIKLMEEKKLKKQKLEQKEKEETTK